MLYSCTNTTTVGVKGLKLVSETSHFRQPNNRSQRHTLTMDAENPTKPRDIDLKSV